MDNITCRWSCIPCAKKAGYSGLRLHYKDLGNLWSFEMWGCLRDENQPLLGTWTGTVQPETGLPNRSIWSKDLDVKIQRVIVACSGSDGKIWKVHESAQCWCSYRHFASRELGYPNSPPPRQGGSAPVRNILSPWHPLVDFLYQCWGPWALHSE